ncbi:universal stress protein [Nocardioides sp. AX2bis]|uniref:universal stress protein n=1 Tax=Nocardioides sp. AX2bis TaxID=2653157 RepID=UPI0012F43E50|nr:universal stress protein [Nocardioides sp. AX2bis]VXC46763.1 Universal stress protein family [Nocardioides sp. AX2bis]
MSSSPVTAGSVVIAHDSSGHSAEALAWGLEQAALERRPVAVVRLLNVTEVQSAAWIATSGAGLQVLHDLREQAVTDMEALVAIAREHHPGLEVDGHVIERETRQGLVELSASAHLVVLGSHGRGPVGSLLLGSVAAAVTRRADCPVVVVRPPSDSRLAASEGAGVLVGVDGTAESLPVVEQAFAQASLRGLPLTAVHCIQDLVAAYAGSSWVPEVEEVQEAERGRQALLDHLAGVAEKHPDVPLTVRVEHGLVAQVVGNRSRPWDLVVVGRRRHGAWHRLLVASTTTAVLENARCPVLVVPEASVPGERG